MKEKIIDIVVNFDANILNFLLFFCILGFIFMGLSLIVSFFWDKLEYTKFGETLKNLFN